MVERMVSRTESELAWAERTASETLSTLNARWRHTLRVVDRAQPFRELLGVDELEVLLGLAQVTVDPALTRPLRGGNALHTEPAR
jgi:hypothetical protein